MDSDRRDEHAHDANLDAWIENLRSECERSNSARNEARMRQALQEFRQDLREHPYVKKGARRKLQRQWIWSRWTRATRWTLALGSGVTTAAALLLLLLVASRTASGTSWEDVVKRFRSVTSFSVKLYDKDNPLQKPEERDLWMGANGQVRMRLGSVVIFARNGKVIKAYDTYTRKETSPDSRSVQLLEKFSKSEFSLNVVFDSIIGGRVFDAATEVRTSTEDAEEFDVFEVQAPTGEAKIWTLSESKLPLRMLFKDTVNDSSVEAFFTYTGDQAEGFFDPAAFEKRLSVRSSVPQTNTLLEKAPVPVVESAGITTDGAIWIMATSARHGRPGSDNYAGFNVISDDQGRAYNHITSAYQTKEDRSLDVFVLKEYPFDRNLPNAVTAEATDAEGHVLGKRRITNLAVGIRWPAEIRVVEPIVIKGQQLIAARDWASLNRLLAMIPGESAKHELALEREKLRLASLVAQRDYAAATSVGETLLPLLEKQYQDIAHPASAPSLFNDHILALACDGKTDRAQAVIDRVRDLVDALPSAMPERQRAGVLRNRQQFFRANLVELASRLSDHGMLSPEIISETIRVDVRKESPFKDVPAFR